MRLFISPLSEILCLHSESLGSGGGEKKPLFFFQSGYLNGTAGDILFVVDVQIRQV